MSKSKNNVVEPDKIIKQSGADILRLWVASEDYSSEVRLSDTILDGIKDKYKKLRNTLRFLLGNINDFEEKDFVDFEKNLFHQGISKVLNFTANELSSIYLDIQKDILYTFSIKSHQRKSTQSAIVNIFREITLMLSPVISFTTEEAWKHFNQNKSSIFEETLSSDFYEDEEIEIKWNRLMEYRTIFLKEIEIKRSEKIIGSSLEAKILVSCPVSHNEFLKENLVNLQKVLMVSELDLSDLQSDEVRCDVQKTKAPKCVRCWNYSFQRGPNDKNICLKCHEQLIL